MLKTEMDHFPEGLEKRPYRFYFFRHKRTFVVGLICLFFTNLLDAMPPLLIGYALDQITGEVVEGSVVKTLGLLLIVTLFLSFFRYLWRIFWGRFHHTVAEDLRNRIFYRYTQLGPSFYSKRSVGELMSLISNDVNSFRMGVGPGVLILFDAFFILLIVPPLMARISLDWTWQTLVLLPFIPFAIRKLMDLIRDSYKTQQEKFATLSGTAQEIVSGIRVIKSYAQEINQTRLFNYGSRKYEDACNRVGKVDSLFDPVMEIGVSVGSVILLIIGAPDVISGAVTMGSFFAFYQYIQRMMWPMTALGIGANFVQKGRASFDRIAELLRTQSDVPDLGVREIKTFESLEIRNLTFTYPGESEPTLKNISLQLAAGETLGIVGPIGSGKSTLIELLCRQYPIEPETIFINAHPIEEYRKADLMNLFSVVPQDAFLFSRKVSENIALGKKQMDMREVRTIAELVNIEKEIEDIPYAYDAYLGERGVNLSGGQKQRLTMARALIRNSPVIILDDSLSAVDANTEKNILKRLKGRLQDDDDAFRRTSIIISHRLASLRWADKILVIKNGEVEQMGTHDELLRGSSTYQTIYELQSEGGL